MTLSEYIQAHRIRALLRGLPASTLAPALICGDTGDNCAARVEIRAGRGTKSYPEDDAGPWSAFEVTVRTSRGSDGPRTIPAADILEILDEHGWPEAQLGRRWRKPRGNVPAGR